MKRIRYIAFGLMLLAGPALAQQPVFTYGTKSSTDGAPASGTIAVSNTFQKVFSSVNTTASESSPLRKGCTIQNNGSNNMWVEEGATAGTAAKANSVVLTPGSAYSCSAGGTVLQGEVDITGTSADAFYAAQY